LRAEFAGESSEQHFADTRGCRPRRCEVVRDAAGEPPTASIFSAWRSALSEPRALGSASLRSVRHDVPTNSTWPDEPRIA